MAVSKYLRIMLIYTKNFDLTDFPSYEPKEFSAVETIIPAVEAMNEISFSNFDYFQHPDKYNFSSHDQSKSLELEFSLLSANFNLPNVKFNEVSSRRSKNKFENNIQSL